MWWAPIAGAAIDWLSGAHGASRQMDFQERMRSTQYQAAAADLEKAGLNRVLALGQPAASPSGAAPPPSRFSDSMIQAASAKQAIETGEAQEDLLRTQKDLSEAQAAKTRTETLVSLELLPLQKQQLGSQSNQADQAAELSRVNAMLGELEEDKQKVVKSLYTEFGPVIIDIIRALSSQLSSAKDASGSIGSAVDKAIQMFTSSAAGQRSMSQYETEQVAKAFSDAVVRGDIPAEKVFDLSPQVREAVFKANPGWRSLKR